MMRMRSVIGMAVLLWVAAGTASAETGKAVIRGTADGSALAGEAVMTETPGGVQVNVRITGAPPGPHGLHIHQFGECQDAGNAAGGHYNPQNVEHGFLPEDGLEKAHPGDLGNIDIGQDGAGTLDIVLPGVGLGGMLNVGGRAIVLHEKMDDFSQPTGNAGGRIGCGPIVLVKP